MRTLIAVVTMVLTLAVVGPAAAQTRASAPPTENRSPAVTIDLNTVGAGLSGLVIASGLVNLYNAGSQFSQGASIVEALEVGAGLPVMAALAAVVVGGMFGQDIFAYAVAPLMGSGEPAKPAH